MTSNLHLRPALIWSIASAVFFGGIWVGSIQINQTTLATAQSKVEKSLSNHNMKEVHSGADVRLSVIETQVGSIIVQQQEAKRETKDALRGINSRLDRLLQMRERRQP